MIAILGATGYIGRSLARFLAKNHTEPITLFARNVAALEGYWPAHVSCRDLAGFDADEFALVINAIGVGDPEQVKKLGAGVLDLTYIWDQRVLETMSFQTRYVFLSSGAIYGTQFAHCVGADACLQLPVNKLADVPPYVIAKLYAEARHRYASDRHILDVRIFGFADQMISRRGSSFLAALTRSVATGEPLLTSSDDMVRDYAGACELSAFIECWRTSGAANLALDLYSLAPTGKFEVLRAAVERYGLKIQTVANNELSPTGVKPHYASTFRGAESLGYRPHRTSIQVVLDALDAIRGAQQV